MCAHIPTNTYTHVYTHIHKTVQGGLFYIITYSKELMLDTEIPLCNFGDAHNKNIS